jgi:hypothetical protein
MPFMFIYIIIILVEEIYTTLQNINKIDSKNISNSVLTIFQNIEEYTNIVTMSSCELAEMFIDLTNKYEINDTDQIKLLFELITKIYRFQNIFINYAKDFKWDEYIQNASLFWNNVLLNTYVYIPIIKINYLNVKINNQFLLTLVFLFLRNI